MIKGQEVNMVHYAVNTVGSDFRHGLDFGDLLEFPACLHPPSDPRQNDKYLCGCAGHLRIFVCFFRLAQEISK